MTRTNFTAPAGDQAKLDVAARAGWLYYVAGRTQEEIAEILRISRPTAQRLVSLAISEKLVTFQFNHPIGACMEAGEALTRRFALQLCEIVITDPLATGSLNGVSDRAATLLERYIAGTEPVVIALGTGRAMRATVERITPSARSQHRLVSLVGTVSPEGSATHFDAAGRLADLTGATHYPMPLPVVLPEDGDREMLLALAPMRRIRLLAEAADLSIVGIGNVGVDAPLRVDGFLSRDEMHEHMRMGAVGEIVGWSFDIDGKPLGSEVNRRVSSIRPLPSKKNLVVGVALGAAKIPAMAAALRGGLINGLITDEVTATELLKL